MCVCVCVRTKAFFSNKLVSWTLHMNRMSSWLRGPCLNPPYYILPLTMHTTETKLVCVCLFGGWGGGVCPPLSFLYLLSLPKYSNRLAPTNCHLAWWPSLPFFFHHKGVLAVSPVSEAPVASDYPSWLFSRGIPEVFGSSRGPPVDSDLLLSLCPTAKWQGGQFCCPGSGPRRKGGSCGFLPEGS